MLRGGEEGQLLRPESSSPDGDVRLPVSLQELRQRLFPFVARRVPQPEDADDVLQHVFLQLHRQREEPQHVGAWLHQAARNAVADFYRSAARRRETSAGTADDLESLGGFVPALEETDVAKAQAEAAACLRPLMERLPAHYRNALVLTELEGLSQRGAAAREGVSVSGLKSRVQRGRRLLKQKVLDACGIEVDRRGGVMGCTPRLSCDCEARRSR